MSLAPKTFELDKEMISKVKDGPLDNPEVIKQAVDGCPVQAITVCD